ncbi:hypothetical protein MNV49_007914 [Pseudohyphozyma bogoriensis]|nr:hypothetical protein MNV49_007914 [Pseudohyphozyma bogoriensis]
MPDASTSPVPVDLSIGIVGAGIGGLAAAVGLCQRGFKDVVVYEAAPQIAEIGAGIQVAPNFCRVLESFGLLEEVKKSAVRLDRNSVRRYANNVQIGTTSFASLEDAFGYPTFVVHRADLHTALLNKAIELGATLKVNSWVSSVDFEATTLTVKDTIYKHDLIIAADGIKSPIRGKMMERGGEEDETVDTGTAAYRVILDRSQMESDPELKELVDSPVAVRVLGPDAHLMLYPIKAHEKFNIVTTHLTHAVEVPEDWTNKASKPQMLARFANYAPIYRRLLELAPDDELVEWNLRIHHALTTWVDGNVALLGDSAHATLPHLAQGAAQAGEDGAVLAAVLAKISTKEDIPKALAAYQRLRKPRADWAVETARLTGQNLHLPDGPAQEARDEMIGNAGKGGKNPDKWGDKDTQTRLYGLDVVREALEDTSF